SNRVGRSEEFPGQRLIDYGNFPRRVYLDFGEDAAAQQFQAERREVSFAAQLIDRAPLLRMRDAGRVRLADNASVRRQRAGLGYRNHSRKLAQALEDLLEEL